MNNKGFAITTVLYGTFLLFLLLTATMLGITVSYKNKMEVLIDNTNGARDIIENGNRADVEYEEDEYVNPTLQVGDYVKYSVTVNGKVHDKWRVLFINGSNIEIVKDVNSSDQKFTLSATEDSYERGVKILNDEASKYRNSVATGARSLGYDPTCSHEIMHSEATYNMSGFDADDTCYVRDVEQLKNNGMVSNVEVWLASRRYTTINPNGCNGRDAQLRTMLSNGNLDYHTLEKYIIKYDIWIHSCPGNQPGNNQSYYLRPVITLPSGYLIGTGDGKSVDTAWELIY